MPPRRTRTSWLLPQDPEPQPGRQRCLADTDAFQPDVCAALVVEEPDAVTEQYGSDEHEHLVKLAGVQALLRDARAEDVDVLVAGSRFSGRERAAEISDEGDSWHNDARYLMREYELRSVPTAAERLPILLGALVRVVAAERPVPR